MNPFHTLVNNQRTFFKSEQTLPYAFRKEQLKKLRDMLKTYEKDIYQALNDDLNKSKNETLTTELGFLYSEIDVTIKHLKEWMKAEKVDTPITHKGSKSFVLAEPYGVTITIAPWNYPLQLAIAPVIGALAAGNTVIIKPSEFTMATSSLLAHMIGSTFDANYVAVVEGAEETSQQLLELKFDYIFFTGSTNVGKIIMKQASEHLTPVTLELGGKSPAIVDKDANIDLAAKRIVWGKFTNAGQTCVAPDFLFVHEKVKQKVIKAMKKHIKSFYGKDPVQNKNYGRIVNTDHFDRLKYLLAESNIVYGGGMNRELCSIEPTIIDDATFEDPIMEEEIFGPLLPVLTFQNLEEAIAVLKGKEKPLSLYFFGENAESQQKVLGRLSFGGGCINDTLYHLANPNLPFGGVGTSGMGSYHGKDSFDTFSHKKSILKQTTKFDIPLRYPGGKIAHNITKRIMK
ncbi:aldehyde dehydrogenase family protein [Virgibacillus phasianinus]|uniref:Aldehyde dehydrogenase n=1 Tax=Virgibacillus phasianinus TaxID=2017483 RepID=A0A220U540_9BACI|nr:aldehyde dehydrogenase [Virgibacillus phasianinus]ASK63268.1 aldehyde dehydrogenase family protein [Virgibacillus phasianinus]